MYLGENRTVHHIKEKEQILDFLDSKRKTEKTIEIKSGSLHGMITCGDKQLDEMRCKIMLTNSNTSLELYAPFARNTIEVGSKRPLMVKHQKERVIRI